MRSSICLVTIYILSAILNFDSKRLWRLWKIKHCRQDAKWAIKSMWATLPWISCPVCFAVFLFCMLSSYVIRLWLDCVLPCFSCSFSVTEVVFVLFFPPLVKLYTMQIRGVVEKAWDHGDSKQSWREKQTWLPRVVVFFFFLYIYSSLFQASAIHQRNTSPECAQSGPEQNFKEVITLSSWEKEGWTQDLEDEMVRLV